MMPEPPNTMPTSSRMLSIMNSSSNSACTEPGSRSWPSCAWPPGFMPEPHTMRPSSWPLPMSADAARSPPSTGMSRPPSSASWNFCLSSCCFAGLSPSSMGCTASAPRVWKTVTASATALPRTRVPSVSSKPATTKGRTSASVQDSSSSSSASSRSPARRPGKCCRRMMTVSSTPKYTFVLSRLFATASSRSRRVFSMATRPGTPRSAQKSTHFRAASWRRTLESPRVTLTWSSSTPSARSTSGRGAHSSRPMTSTKRSIATIRTGMTLSRMTWWSSWQLMRQRLALSCGDRDFPMTRVEPGFCQSPMPFRTLPTSLRAWARLSHLWDCRCEETIGPNAWDSAA
mmetsp:Transcript_15072/g.45190  ORF Transcript_15072/g.45190 Transcript_15072/m.45190 type:complete len:344 (+) Transcript_15072:655-1686(+)